MIYRVEPMEDFFVVRGAYEGEGDDRFCFKGSEEECEEYIKKQA